MIYALLCGMAALLIAAVRDSISRIIPDSCVIIVALSGVLMRFDGGPGSAFLSIAIAMALFAGMIFLFHIGAVGGGDAKLVPAASLLFPAAAVPKLLFFISISGGLLALAWIGGNYIIRRTMNSPDDGGGAAPADRPTTCEVQSDAVPLADQFGYQGQGLPYGVAIFVGAVASQVFLR